jgi:hypothetical protein
MTVKITGLKEIQQKLNEFVFDMDKAVDDAVRITAFAVQGEAVKLIKEPSVGTYVTRYTASGNPKRHLASKAGDAPNSDTGDLIKRIDVTVFKGEQLAYVFTDLDYGFYLETVLDRPFLEPAKESKKADFSKFVTVAIDKQIKAIG